MRELTLILAEIAIQKDEKVTQYIKKGDKNMQTKNNELVNTLFSLSKNNSVSIEQNTKDGIHLYPSRILIFDEIKDGRCWFKGTDEELKNISDEVANKYVEYLNEYLGAQKTIIIDKQIVDSIFEPCKELLLTLKVFKKDGIL